MKPPRTVILPLARGPAGTDIRRFSLARGEFIMTFCNSPWPSRNVHRLSAFHRSNLRWLFAVFFCLAGSVSADDERTWKDASGSITKKGSLDRVDGDWIHLQLQEGGALRLPLAWFSQADQDYIASRHQVATPTSEATPQPARASAGPPSTLVALMVNGVGISKEEAEKDAYRNAIRQVVGAYVDAETIVANDEIIRDNVITLSSAYIERAATKSVAQENGLFKVTVDAKIRITKLLDSLKQHNVSIVDIDASAAQDAIAKALTQEDQAKGKEDLLVRALGSYPESCLRAIVDGEPTFTRNAIQFRVKIEPDMEVFAAVADKVCESLGADGRRQGVLRNDSKHCVDGGSPNDDSRRQEAEARFLDSVEQLFHNKHHIVAVNDRGHNSNTLSLPSLMSLAMETPNGLRDPSGAAFVQAFNSDHYLFIPFRANMSLQRIHWRWFAFSPEELNALLKAHRRAIAVHTSILDSNQDEIVDDLCGISLGWSDLDSYASVVAPFVCCPYRSLYVPSFSFVRTIELAADELLQARSVKCSLQSAQWPSN